MDFMDSEDQVTNPEMPLELIDQDLVNIDTIKDTVFSRHWTLSVLLDFARYMMDKELYDNPELGDEFHDNMCKLWDMSVNENVAIFLMENEFLEILSACTEKSASPRAIEISVGILANMVSVHEVCEAVEKEPQLMRIPICLLQSPHSPVLIETLRLLTTCISRSQSVQKWMDEIRESSEVYDSVLFYFQSSTNSSLLEKTAEFVDGVLAGDDDICVKWSTPELVGAIMEALVQLGPDIGEPGKTFLHILQCISTCKEGVQALVVHAEKAFMFSLSYLRSFCSEDFIVIDGKETSIASSLAILSATFPHYGNRKEFIAREYTIIRCLLKLVEVAHQSGKDKTEGASESATTDPNKFLTEYIYELLMSLLQDSFSTLLQVSVASLQTDGNKAKIPKSLEYLETVCDENRLKFFFKTSTDHNLWLDVAKAFNCLRLIDYLSSDLSNLEELSVQ